MIPLSFVARVQLFPRLTYVSCVVDCTAGPAVAVGAVSNVAQEEATVREVHGAEVEDGTPSALINKPPVKHATFWQHHRKERQQNHVPGYHKRKG